MAYQHINEFQRLPYDLKPLNYNLEFLPNISESKFFAEATVKFQVLERTNKIILNSKNLNILSAFYEQNEAEIAYEESQELVILTFPTSLQLGTAELMMKFEGILNDDMQGFYRSSYKSPTGEESSILCTQFESVYARRAFPCMDEPDRKATFDITIIALDGQVALSNMPEVYRSIIPPPHGLPLPPDGRNYVKVKFDTSPVMSTYLLAMVVGKFDFISARDSNGVAIRVFTPPGKQACGEYALEVAGKSLPFFANLFGHKYPLPKLDLIAIPDFGCGAMENWGLITYREVCLLIDKEQSSLMSKQSVALTVAHELAHMWFGNLVTMQWWTDLWLNEGFATWIEYLAVDYCFPDYDIWTLFVSQEYVRALKLDELKTSHPIEVEVKSPNEVEEIFDAVSYQKGASVIRMLNDYLGSEIFIAGLQHYINRHKYGNTVTKDLWKALTEVSGQPVEEIMSTWTKQMGYPVLSVRRIDEADGNPVALGVSQCRFLADASLGDKQSKWFIPLSVCKADDSTAILSQSLIPPSLDQGATNDSHSPNTKDEYLIQLPEAASVRLNPSSIGFFRVSYDPSMLPSIMHALSQGKISEKERLCLINDSFALARSGHCALTVPLNLALALTPEMKFSVWSVMVSGLSNARRLIEESTYEHGNEVEFPAISIPEVGLNNLCTKLALPVYAKIGWDPRPEDTNNELLLRPIILSLLGRAMHPEIIERARCAFDAHYLSIVNTPDGQPHLNTIPPDLRTTVYSIYMRNGGNEEFNRLLTLHDKATMHDERERILASLGNVRSPVLIDKIFKLVFSNFVRKQDRYFVLFGVTGSSGGRRALWRLVKSRISSLQEDLATTSLLSHVLKGSCSSFCTSHSYEEVKNFFDVNPVPCSRAIEQALESIKINCSQLSRDEASLSAFLSSFA